MRQLRPHQVEMIEQLREAIRQGHKRIMVSAPCSFGKTLTSAAIIDSGRKKGKRFTFISPAILVDKTCREFEREGLTDIGVIRAQDHRTNYAKPIQVASVQTLARRGRPECDIVLNDEAHIMHKTVLDWMAEEKDKIFIGLSGTPWAKGLGKHYDKLIVVRTTKQMMDEGYLVRPRVFGPSVPDLSKVRTVAGDYNEADSAKVMNTKTLVADVVEFWLKNGENRPTMCFCTNRAHAQSVFEAFRVAGVSCGYIDAFTPQEDRDALERGMNDGSIRVTVNIGCCIMGTDWPFVSCIIWARPCKSEMTFAQAIGRGYRLSKNHPVHGTKVDLKVFDHAATHFGSKDSLGFAEDIHYSELNDGTRDEVAPAKKKEAQPVKCAQCSFIRPPKSGPICPACGAAAKRESNVETVSGTLVEFGTKPAERAPKFDHFEKQRWYSALLGLAKEKGYNPGWAAQKYKTKFGVWPRGLRDNPVYCGDVDILYWVKAQQIRYAKRRKAA